MDTPCAFLDARRRAMLRAMGVTQGWPLESTPGVTRPAPAVVPVPAMALSPSQNATKNIAASANSTGVAAQFDSKDQEVSDWPTLQRQVQSCRLCTRCHDAHPPWTSGLQTLPQADWMVVGELPQTGHAHEDQTFGGEAGALLDNILRALDLRRADSEVPRARAAHLTLAVRCRGEPVRNPTPDEAAACAQHLAREVALVQPRVIVALGRWAALTLLHAEHSPLAHQPLGKLRGQVWRFQGHPLVVSFAPGYLLHKPVEKARAWADWSLARQALGNSGVIPS